MMLYKTHVLGFLFLVFLAPGKGEIFLAIKTKAAIIHGKVNKQTLVFFSFSVLVVYKDIFYAISTP